MPRDPGGKPAAHKDRTERCKSFFHIYFFFFYIYNLHEEMTTLASQLYF